MGWLAKKDRRRRKKESAQGLTSQLLAPRFLRGSMPARPSYSQRAPLAQLVGRPGRTPSASSRPALPGSVGQSPARRLRGTGLEGGPPPRADPCAHPPGRPESPGTGDRGREPQVLEVPSEAWRGGDASICLSGPEWRRGAPLSRRGARTARPPRKPRRADAEARAAGPTAPG